MHVPVSRLHILLTHYHIVHTVSTMSGAVETQTTPVPPTTDPEALLAAKDATDSLASEPQNALTKEFTDAEWQALRTFRVGINRTGGLRT